MNGGGAAIRRLITKPKHDTDAPPTHRRHTTGRITPLEQSASRLHILRPAALGKKPPGELLGNSWKAHSLLFRSPSHVVAVHQCM